MIWVNLYDKVRVSFVGKISRGETTEDETTGLSCLHVLCFSHHKTESAGGHGAEGIFWCKSPLSFSSCLCITCGGPSGGNQHLNQHKAVFPLVMCLYLYIVSVDLLLKSHNLFCYK